jgi:hypothetical protein
MRWGRLVCQVMIAVACLSIGNLSRAATLLYTITGADNLSFELDSNPSVTFDATTDNGFYLTDVANTSSNSPFPFLIFYDSAFSGGLIAASTLDTTTATLYLNYFSPQLFTGSLTAPEMLTGTFSLLSPLDDSTVVDNLTVTAVPAVPEAPTWAMMLLALACFGFVTLRRRSRAPAF